MRRGVIQFLEIASISILLSACSNSVFFPSDSPQVLGDDASAISFSTSLYPILVENCSSCHGHNQAPLFAIANDAQSSHDNLLPDDGVFINFDDPRSSPLALKVFRGHNCWSGDCAADGQEIVDAIQVWKEGRGSQGSQITGIATESLVIPESLNTDNKIETLEFDLSGLNGGLVPNGTSLKLQIEKFDDNQYLISDPTIYSSSENLIQTVKVYINRQKIDAAAWELIDLTAPAEPIDGYAIAQGASSILAPIGYGITDGSPSGPGVDTLTISFEYIGPPADPQQIRFSAALQVIQQECASCHRGARSVNYLNDLVPAFGDISTESGFLNMSYGQTHVQTLVVPGDAAASSLFQSVAHGVNGNYANYGSGMLRTMPPGASNADRLRWSQTLADWINGIQ